MKRFKFAVLEGIALVYLVHQSFLLFQKIEELKNELTRQKQLSFFFHTLAVKGNCGLKEYFEMHQIHTIAVYGTGRVYQAIANELSQSADILYFIDKRCQTKQIDGKPVVSKEFIGQMGVVDGIIVTAVGFFHEIENEVGEELIKKRLINIENVIYYDRAKRLESGDVW